MLLTPPLPPTTRQPASHRVQHMRASNEPALQHKIQILLSSPPSFLPNNPKLKETSTKTPTQPHGTILPFFLPFNAKRFPEQTNLGFFGDGADVSACFICLVYVVLAFENYRVDQWVGGRAAGAFEILGWSWSVHWWMEHMEAGILTTNK